MNIKFNLENKSTIINQQKFLVKHKNLKKGGEIVGEDGDYKTTDVVEPLHAQNYDEITEDCPLVSERAGHGDHSDNSIENERHVQFGQGDQVAIIKTVFSKNEHIPENIPERKRRKRYFSFFLIRG